MTGFDKYFEIFGNRVKELLKEEGLTKNPEYHKVFMNQLLGLKGPKQLDRKVTPHDACFSKLFVGFKEISDSYYSLLDIEIYVGRFPYGKSRVSKTRYLAYHMENYLNEVYILKERMKSYFTIVGRLYRNDQTLKEVKKTMNTLSDLVQSALKGITYTRSTHVHSNRFTDENLDRLRSLELVNHGSNQIPVLRILYDSAYRNTRRKYIQTLKHNNEELKRMLDACCDVLYGIVADENGQIRYPESKTA
jgi:hypothetical protein